MYRVQDQRASVFPKGTNRCKMLIIIYKSRKTTRRLSPVKSKGEPFIRLILLQRKVWSAPDVRVYDKSTKLPRWTKLVIVELNELYKMIVSRQRLSNDPERSAFA
jgi:hypothetical protein